MKEIDKESRLIRWGFQLSTEIDEDGINSFILYRNDKEIDRLKAINSMVAINHFYDNAMALIYE